MTSVSVMMTVFVLNLHYRGPKKNEIPFWLQQLLSISLANVVRTLRKSKKSNTKNTPKKTEDTKNYPSINGLILSYMNINETKSKALTTTTTTTTAADVRQLFFFLFKKHFFLRCPLKYFHFPLQRALIVF